MRTFFILFAVLALTAFGFPLPKHGRKFQRFSGFQHHKGSFKKFDSSHGSFGGFRGSPRRFAHSKRNSFGGGFQPEPVVDDSKPSIDEVSPPPPEKDCGYTEGTLTAPLMAEREIELGTVTVVVKNTTVDVSYKLESQDCILIGKMHVNIVDEPLTSVHPSKFPCVATGNQETLQNMTCPLNLFDTKCCGTKTMYVEATLLCAGEVGTVYAGETGCAGSDDWCNTMTLEPPCACGCDETAEKCIAPSVTCPECGGEVCAESECTDFVDCPDTELQCGGEVCDMSECRTKVVKYACPFYDSISKDVRQIRPNNDAANLRPVSRQMENSICPEECCPIGETVTLIRDLFEARLGSLPQFVSADTDVLVGCCPFCEILKDGSCSPAEGKCDPCTIGARNACKAVGDDYKCCPPSSNCMRTVFDLPDTNNFVCSKDCGSCADDGCWIGKELTPGPNAEVDTIPDCTITGDTPGGCNRNSRDDCDALGKKYKCCPPTSQCIKTVFDLDGTDHFVCSTNCGVMCAKDACYIDVVVPGDNAEASAPPPCPTPSF